MEYVEGESLHDLLAREKVLPPNRALELISAICAGVGAAHHQGIVHRDLKPLNIMICNDKPNMSQAVKILDFGLAKIKSGELLGSFIQAQTTGLMGSPYYMAPEQWADDEPDSRSDIYSLGVMLFQMLAGDVPFKGSSIPAIMKKHISDPAPTFAEVGVSLPLEIEAAVRHTLQKEKEKRTPSVEVMIDELRAAIDPVAFGIHTTSGTSLPASSLNILTDPPKSSVFLNSMPVGQSREDGWLMLESVQTGNHQIRVSHSGFDDWVGAVSCDGRPQRLVAQLKSTSGAAASPTVAYAGGPGQNTPHNMSSTNPGELEMQKTALHDWDTGRQHIGVQSQPPPKRKFFSPLVIGALALAGFLGLGVIALGGAYFSGMFSGKRDADATANTSNTTNRPTATPIPSKVEMAPIPGGSFTMGRNVGAEIERPNTRLS